MIQKIIFDLDGTLVDTLGGIAYACNQVLTAYGYETHDKEAYKAFVGSGLVTTIKRALPQGVVLSKEQMKEMVESFVSIYDAHPNYDTKPYEGIEALLSAIEARGIAWGIHTNKHEFIAQKIADVSFADRDYIGLRGTSESTAKKPDPQGTYQLLGQDFDPDQVLFVGDTEVDIDTARALGVSVVAVSWGFRDKADLQKKEPDWLIDTPMALLDCIDSKQ